MEIGLVGCGGMGRRHLAGYAALHRLAPDAFRITAVCDPQPAAATAAADLVEALHGARPAVFAGHEELIASGAAGALDIVTDPSVHHVIAVPALEHGLHVICEKPLGITVRACRAIVDASARSGAVLATAENYRRDPPNRLARAVLEHGLLGEIHLLTQYDIGGSDEVIISPWRHLREAGSIALDMGVHYTDLFAFFLGELDSVSGTAFVAEPLRVMPAGSAPLAGVEEEAPGVIRATGDDSLVALYRSAAGVPAQLAYVPSGPGHHWLQRSVHGREGSMSIPPDRSGGDVVAHLRDRTLSGDELRRAIGFELDGVTAALFGRAGTAYDLPFADVDAALIAIELDDFIRAVAEKRPPEVDGDAGLAAVAAVWAVAESDAAGTLPLADVIDGSVSAAQDPIDLELGLLEIRA